MEPIEVDSGVVIKWFVDEPHAVAARRLRDQYRAGSISLLAPDLMYAELGNILWKKQRLEGLAAETATSILTELQSYSISLTSARDLLEDAHQIAVAHGRTVYDALYLALGIREGCRFVTADERLFNAVGPAFPNMVWVANWP
jgi:predicted nucleic acid-binding protein